MPQFIQFMKEEVKFLIYYGACFISIIRIILIY